MIQRIQTLFLTIAAGLLISMFFTPMVKIMGPEGVADIVRYVEIYPTLIMTLVTTVLCIATIFYYRKRIMQIRICNINTLILIGYQAYLIVYYIKFRDTGMVPCITAVFPIAAAILTFIAMRYIARDEALVMAASHLRSRRKNRK
ncbi:MAG TPA: DUF4293 domain-containing protein [Candidatus Coprenecus stercoripullorum]|nr:DUF4293 domain-containing protein [Candidatus Coprenecus stercoripullorum]